MHTSSRMLAGLLVFCAVFAAIAAIGGHEKTKKQDLFTLRQIVSQYTLDYQKKPHSFDDLINASYLNSVPAWLPEGSAQALFADEPEIRDSPLPFPFKTTPYDVLAGRYH